MTNLGEMYGRETVKCDCGLTQFITANKLCRRCKASPDPEPIVEQVLEPAPEPMKESGPSGLNIGGAVRFCRQALQISQRQLALRMKCPRTYVSKVERGHDKPSIAQMQRVADALWLPLDFLVTLCEVRGL